MRCERCNKLGFSMAELLPETDEEVAGLCPVCRKLDMFSRRLAKGVSQS